MATKVVQVKVRVEGDGLEWSQREAIGEFHVTEADRPEGCIWVHNMTGKTLVEKAMEIALAYNSNAKEVRWNFKESLQGHYHDVKGAY